MMFRMWVAVTFLMIWSPIGSAQVHTPAYAKELAERSLQLMVEIESYAVVAAPARIDASTYMEKFDAPLAQMRAEWPAPLTDPKYKVFEPYSLCVEALQDLALLKMHRLNFDKGVARDVSAPEMEKARTRYFSNSKPRCAESIKTGRFPEKR